MIETSVIVIKSKSFAIRIIKLYRFLNDEKNEYVIAKQILKSGTSIGANVKEASKAQSKADFISKNSIALKEASETEYWLELLYESGYLDKKLFESLYSDNLEILKLLTSIINSAKKNEKNSYSIF